MSEQEAQELHASPSASASKGGTPIGFMIFCGAVIALVSMGVRNIVPLWQAPMLQDLGWSSINFTIAIATQNLIWGALSPVFGGLADRFGAAKVLIFGALLQIAGLWVMSMANEPAVFFLSAGLMIGTAQAAAGMGIVLGAIGRLVDESKRTIAFGLITSASSAGMIILTPIGRTLLETQGWSAAFLAVAVLTLPMLLLAPFIGRKRSDGEPTTAAVAHQTVGSALSEALKHKGYILLTIGFFVCGFHVTFVGAHFSNYLESEGLGWQLGATALMIIGVFNVVSCLGVGVIASFLSKKGVLSIIYFGRAALVGAFLLFPLTEWSVYIFSAVLGILWLSTVPPTQGLVAQLFGTQYMTMLFGVVFFSHQIGSFLGAWLGALAFDHLGSYDLIWLASIGLGILSGVCHLFIDERPVDRLQVNTPAATPAE